MLQQSLAKGKPVEQDVDLLALAVVGGAMTGAAGTINRALGGALKRQATEEGFKGKKGESMLAYCGEGIKPRRVYLYGISEEDGPFVSARAMAANAARTAEKLNLRSVAIVVPGAPNDADLATTGASLGLAMGAYRFPKYLSKDKKPSTLRSAVHLVSGKGLKAAREGLARGIPLIEGTVSAMDLVNEPPSILHPESFADRAAKMAEEKGLECEILTPEEMEKKGMGLLLAVGRGGERKPRMVRLTYKPKGRRRGPVLALVGKGITFDSGGLNLKPGASMAHMHADMAGAGAVFGAMAAIADLAPRCMVHAILALAENMPDGRSYKPNDVIKGMNGKSVEITNTDAEGRLAMADALVWAEELGAAEVIDMATLTGAAVVALGLKTAAIMGNDQQMLDRVKAASERGGEPCWPMPLLEDIREPLKSEVADIKNSGDRWGGAIAAGLFLREFVGQTRWVHIDIAGPSHSDRAKDHIPKGGTGFGVGTLVEYVTGSR